ncbi:MAG: DeoR/GlpR transcriptional regulator, partial [Ruminococcaceae bacterium]|nr:DeoR/GlpR transcriptional regulator [Oscillospiraceae bacterium]
MYIEERHQAILDIISNEGSISTARIQQEFGVGYDSAKRDLRILEEKGLLRRTHGGAIPV